MSRSLLLISEAMISLQILLQSEEVQLLFPYSPISIGLKISVATKFALAYQSCAGFIGAAQVGPPGQGHGRAEAAGPRNR